MLSPRWLCLAAALTLVTAAAQTPHIPASQGTALDGHTVTLPHDLYPVTILILGFSKRSAIPAMAWGMKLQSLAHPPEIGFYDLPILAEAPSIIRPLIVRSMRQQVPGVIKPNFVPLTENAGTWKQIAAFISTAPDAAYVLLVDRAGAVRWQTHDALSAATFDQLTAETRKLIAQKP